MADEYDPIECELGICGPCEGCREAYVDPLDCRSDCGHCERCLQDEEDDEETWGDEIPGVSDMSEPEQKTPTGTKCKGGWIGENDAKITCTMRATKPDGYCDRCRDPLAKDADRHRPVGTIDLTPSWLSIVSLYLELLDRPEFTNNATRRQAMKDEILRAAELADLYVEEHKR